MPPLARRRRTAVLLILGCFAAVVLVILAIVASYTLGRSERDVSGGRSAGQVDAGAGPGPGPQSVVVEGTIATPLVPGGSEPIDVHLTNNRTRSVVITSVRLRVTLASVPQATAELPCTPADFNVSDADVGSVRIRAGGTMSLSQAGVDLGSWPRLTLRNTSVNQDGCKGATLNLNYTAKGRVLG